jgi:DNA primase
LKESPCIGNGIPYLRRDAEQALGQDPSEANYSWLQDVKARLGLLDGTEALIEGFGASSGRPVRSL